MIRQVLGFSEYDTLPVKGKLLLTLSAHNEKITAITQNMVDRQL